jgi:heme-degrading monooxygenase HmoA
MFVRVWRGSTSSAKADDYMRFLRETAYPDYGGVSGNRGWMLLRRPLADSVEFMFVSFWESMEAIGKYTGGNPEQPQYYPEDRAALLELPDRVDHFEIVDLSIAAL